MSCAPEKVATVKAKLQALGIVISGQGTVGGSIIKVEGIAEIDLSKGFKAWFTGLDELFEA